jgi:DNA phosphorothioation-associated putative methyltransferase
MVAALLSPYHLDEQFQRTSLRRPFDFLVQTAPRTPSNRFKMVVISVDDWARYRELVKTVPYGKVLPTATYVHRGEQVCQQGFFGQMLARLSEHHGIGEEFNVVKFRTDAPRLSFLQYSSFFEDAHPCLEEAIAIDLSSGQALRTTYRDSLNPPILHRKELMLAPEHPRSDEFAALSMAEEQAGLYSNTAVIGFRVNWERLLAAHELAIEGHRLIKMTGQEVIAQKRVAVHRHKTALTRYQLSRPVKTLIEYAQLQPSSTFLDYGCGLGGDIRGLVELGFDAKGWDPAYAPDGPRDESDIVNLGYVLNVIEDPAERLDTLSSAWGFAKRLLVVSAQIGDASNEAPRAATLNDGVLTQRNTFQKYFGQQELQGYIEDALDVPALPVALGIFYVFREPGDRQSFLQSRSRRKVDWESLDVGLSKPPRPLREARSARRQRPDPLVEHLSLMERFWSLTLQLGRLPLAQEFEGDAELCAAFGSAKRALRMLLARKDQQIFERAQAARKSDLLVCLASSHLRKSIPFGHLPDTVKTDISVFFGTYSRGLKQGYDLLHSTADSSTILLACDEAAVGWQDERSLYVRSSHADQLPTVLRTLLACAELLYGDLNEADVVRIHKFSGKVTFLTYSNFQSETLPQLTIRTRVDLRAARVDVFDHTGDRQLLYFKERFLDADDPQRERLVMISNVFRRLGISDSVFQGPGILALRQMLCVSGEAELVRQLGLDRLECQQ